MKPKLFFGMSLDFDITLNEQLKNLAAISHWDVGLQKRVYIFPASVLNQVIALTGKEFDFEDQKAELMNFIQHAPGLREEIEVGRWKGEGMLQVTTFPKIFLIKTIIRKTPQTFRIPVETVQTMWAVLKGIEQHKSVKTRDIAEKQIKALGITRYHKETGYFKFNALFGERKDYFHLIYYPLKVLQHYGLIDYSKSGIVTRVKDFWEFQGKLI